MKRDHPDGSSSETEIASRKERFHKRWIDDESAGGMDELLAVMGYKVRSSEMEEVALKMDQLEIMLRSEDGILNLSADTVHYNPSDLSGWVQSMLAKLNVDYSPPTPAISDFFDGDDLRAIPGVAVYPQEAKRMRLSVDSLSYQETRPVVLGDSQEAGVCLVHALLACAEAVQEGSLKQADAWVKRVGALAATEPGTMKKVAFYFAEALARRIYNVHPQETTDSTCPDSLEPHFYDACPYLKFAHFAANQAILDAVSSASVVHVIDFSLKQGMQWPPLLQALARRDGGAPTFRLTSVAPCQIDSWRLEQFADTVGVKFEFQAKDLSEIKPETSDKEVVVVNSVFDFHRHLARPGEIEKVLEAVRSLNPRITTIIEMEANHNGDNFLDRFTQALYYYSSLFDSLEASAESVSPPERRDVLKSELYLGQQIFNVVACEGSERFERHESLSQWRMRMERAGFESVHMGSDAYRSACMHLEHFTGVDGYRVDESDGCLMLGWHTRPIIATSAWRVKCC